MVLLHRWASGGSGGSSRVSAWSLKPAAAAAANSSAMMIQVIGWFSSNLGREVLVTITRRWLGTFPKRVATGQEKATMPVVGGSAGSSGMAVDGRAQRPVGLAVREVRGRTHAAGPASPSSATGCTASSGCRPVSAGPPPRPSHGGPAVNRRRYDAARTVEVFSLRLRDQVELDTLSAELLTLSTRRCSLRRYRSGSRQPASQCAGGRRCFEKAKEQVTDLLPFGGGGETRNSGPSSEVVPGQGFGGGLTCGSLTPV